VTPTELLIPSLLPRSVTMSRISILKRSIRTAVAVCLCRPALAGKCDLPARCLSPSSPICRRARMQIMPRRCRPRACPGSAPVGHRQPHRGRRPPARGGLGMGAQQRQFDQEVDRKLIICHGC
jgi:hypothetical protein